MRRIDSGSRKKNDFLANLKLPFRIPVETHGKLHKKRGSLTGVCAGLGEYFGIEPTVFRLIFMVTSFFSGIGLLVYLGLSIFLPMEGEDTQATDGRFRLTNRPNLFDDGVNYSKYEADKAPEESLSVCSRCDTVCKPEARYCHKCGARL
ncbi:MAG: PspC domain-containing protein [Bacteroidia bacterium]|nr:PspC domain-containing protein [Bacteroidia bacterium]